MTASKAIRRLAIVGVLALLVACEPPEVSTLVQVGAGPSFDMSGSGRLASLTIFGPLKGQKISYPDTDVSAVVWQIQAVSGYFEGTRVQNLQVVYGKVPKSYKQSVPNDAQSPITLQSGLVYSFLAESTGAPVASGSFVLDKSGSPQLLFPNLCLMQKNGQKIRVNCETNEPFEEPLNIDKYVREHRSPK